MNGNRLKEIRESCGISQKLVAEKAYVTESIVQSWEEGWYIIPPSSGEIEEMAILFKLSEEDFRSEIEFYEEDDSDEYNASFLDYIDAGRRAIKHVKNNK